MWTGARCEGAKVRIRGESAGGMSRTGREIGSEYRLWYSRPLIYFCIPLTTVVNYMRRRSEVVNWKDMGMKHEEKDGNAGLVPYRSAQLSAALLRSIDS